MKRVSIMLFAFLIGAVLSQSARADALDDMLAKAKKEGQVVMLELGSVGCIPCEQMRPVMKKLTDNYPGKLEVIFIDVRRDGDAAQRFRVFGIPTQVFLDKNGNEFHRHIGYYAYEEIQPVLKKFGLSEKGDGKKN